MHAAGRRSSHDSLFSGKWRPWDILVRDHGSQGGRGGRGGGNGMSGGNGGSGGNHNREDNDNSNGEGRGRASGNGNNNGGSGRGGSGNGRGSGSGNSNDDDDDAGGNSNGNGDNNRGDTTTKTQKKTTSARSTTKVPSRTTSTPKAKASPTTTTKEAASPAQTQKAQVVESSTSTPAPSPKTKSPSTEDATAVPATRQPAASNSIASNRDDFTSTSSLNSEATELPVPVTLASSERGGLPSGATQVAGAPGPSTNTASSQSPVPGSGGHRGSSNVGAIAAGVVGMYMCPTAIMTESNKVKVGILALLVLIFLGWKFRRSRFLGPITNRFGTNRGGKDRQGINSSPIMGESLLIGAGAMERGRSDGNVSPPAYEDTRSRMEVAAGPLARPSPAMTRSGSHRAHQSTGALHGESSPPRYGDHPRPVPPMAENPTRVPISLIPGPMRVRRATSPTSAARAAPQQGGMGPPTPNLKRKPVANRTMNNLPVPPPEPYGREPSDVSDRRTTNHSGWSSFLPPNEETTDTDKRHRDSFVSIGGVSIASSGVISPSILNWPMPPSTPPTMSVAGLSEDGRQSAQGRVRPGEQPPTVRQVYRPPTQPIPARANMDTAASAHVNDGAEVLTASRITFQQPSRTVVRVQRRSTQSSAPSSVWSESRQLRER